MICVFLLVLTSVLTTHAELTNYSNCGQRTAVNYELINYGTRVRPGEWPWHVGLFHRMDGSAPSYACGGTIITANYILTVAQCVYPPSQVRPLNPEEVLIRAGITHIQKMEHSLQQKTVQKILRHEDQHSSLMEENSIALLKLNGMLEFTNFVKPICLWEESDAEELIVGKNGYVVGWGTDGNGEMSDRLKFTVMPIVSRENCRESNINQYTRYWLDRKTLCAENHNGTSTVVKDSGCGLYIKHNSRWILRGITSNNKMNKNTSPEHGKHYITLTNVTYFISWIKKSVGFPEHEVVVQTVANHAACGAKKELQFRRQGQIEGRMWPWEGQVHRSAETSTILSQVAILNENFVLSLGWVYSDDDVADPTRLTVIFKSFEHGVEQTLLKRKINRILRHEESLMYSIALLEITVPLKFSEHIKPICLWKSDPAWWMISEAVGYSDKLRLRLYDQNSCITNYGIDRSLFRNHSFCSTILTNETRPAYPNFVYIYRGDTWYLRGMAFDMVWSASQYFFLLLDLANYNNWIESNAVVKTNNLLQLVDQDCSRSPHYSFIFQLRINYEFQCYASLITPTLLLTTASCVDKASVESISLLSNALEVTVRRIHLYPSFDRKQLTNNIAIVELYERVRRKSICLPRKLSVMSNLQLEVLSHQVESTAGSLNVSVVDVIQTHSKFCADRWRYENVQVFINRGNICGHMMGAMDEDGFDCRSNLHGAPLVYESEDKTRLFLKGILDIGKANHCDGSDLPEVYTNVLFYAEWISEIASGDIQETTTAPTISTTTTTSASDANHRSQEQLQFFISEMFSLVLNLN